MKTGPLAVVGGGGQEQLLKELLPWVKDDCPPPWRRSSCDGAAEREADSRQLPAPSPQHIALTGRTRRDLGMTTVLSANRNHLLCDE